MNEKYDKERFIERILNNGDSRQNEAMATILDREGLKVSNILDEIQEDRKNQDLHSWS